MPKDNLLQSVISVEASGNRAQNSATNDNQQEHRLIYTLPNNRFFNTGVPLEDINAGTSANSVPWREQVHDHSQQTGRQAESSPRVYTQHEGHVFEEIPQPQYRPRAVLVQEPPAHHHFQAPNLG